jgi:hypothetical protein
VTVREVIKVIEADGWYLVHPEGMSAEGYPIPSSRSESVYIEISEPDAASPE